MQVHKSKIFKSGTNTLAVWFTDMVDDGDVKSISVTGRQEPIHALYKFSVWEGDKLSSAIYSLPSNKHHLKVIINA